MDGYQDIWFYAKGHYPTSNDVIGDLKLVVGKIAAILPAYVGEGEIINVLLSVVFQVINDERGNPPVAFQDFIWRIRSQAEPLRNRDDLGVPIIEACLSVIRTAKPPYRLLASAVDRQLWSSLKSRSGQ